MANNKTVWSSEDGDLRKKKDLTPGPPLRGASRSPEARGESLPPQRQTIHLHRESAGRGGKAVTLVKNLVISAEDMKSLAKRLKQECGSGGTVKDGTIEIQGDHRDALVRELESRGWKVKRAGA